MNLILPYTDKTTQPTVLFPAYRSSLNPPKKSNHGQTELHKGKPKALGMNEKLMYKTTAKDRRSQIGTGGCQRLGKLAHSTNSSFIGVP